MKAVLDANVLYPTVLREILLGVAARGLIQPVWSARILGEWTRAAGRNGGAEDARIAGVEAALLRASTPAAMVADDGEAAAGFDWPDPADRHVVEAAIAAGAGLIVTANLRDFPARNLAALGIEARHPDALLMDLWLADAAAVEAVVAGTHARAVAAGGPVGVRDMLKRVRLPRLGKALAGI